MLSAQIQAKSELVSLPYLCYDIGVYIFPLQKRIFTLLLL